MEGVLNDMDFACEQLKTQRDQYSTRFEHLSKEMDGLKSVAHMLKQKQGANSPLTSGCATGTGSKVQFLEFSHLPTPSTKSPH